MSPGRLQYDTNEAKIARGNGRTYSKKPLIHPIHAHMCVYVYVMGVAYTIKVDVH